MSRLIDADALIELIDGGFDLDFDEVPETKRELIRMVREQPLVDAVEVVHGEWVRTDAFPHRVYCSVCYKTYVTNEEVIQGRSWDCPIYAYEAEYCPHCGAKMDRGEER